MLIEKERRQKILIEHLNDKNHSSIQKSEIQTYIDRLVEGKSKVTKDYCDLVKKVLDLQGKEGIVSNLSVP